MLCEADNRLLQKLQGFAQPHRKHNIRQTSSSSRLPSVLVPESTDHAPPEARTRTLVAPKTAAAAATVRGPRAPHLPHMRPLSRTF